MNAKIIAAILGVSILSVALAFGITFIVQSSFGQPIGFSLSTPTNRVVPFTRTPLPSSTEPASTDTAAERNNCTFSIDVWLKYPENWPIQSYPIGSQTYSREQLIEQITDAAGGPREDLLAQSIAVVLNQQNGADVTAIRNTFSASITLLSTYPSGAIITESDLRKIEDSIQELKRFNTGKSGPPACTYRLSEATPVIWPTRPVVSTRAPTLRPTSLYLPTWTQPPAPRPQQPAPTRRPPDPTSPPPPPAPTDPPPPPPATEVPTEGLP